MLDCFLRKFPQFWRNVLVMTLAIWVSAFSSIWLLPGGAESWQLVSFVTLPTCILAAMALRFAGDE